MLEFEPEIVFSDAATCISQFKLWSWVRRRRMPHIMCVRGDPWAEYWSWFSQVSWARRVRNLQPYTSFWYAYLSARKILPLSKWLDKVIKHHLPWKQTEVVHRGVDPEAFYPEKGFDFRHPSVAIIQTHHILPKVSGLLGFRKVVEKMPAIHFYITEAYPGAQEYLGIVKERYAGLKNVTFVPGENSVSWVRRMLTAADCYVLASGLDSFGISVLEASLMRKPVIASRVGGVPEAVLENETGWTINNDAIDDWVEKISLVTRDSKLNRRMGQRGRQWVSQQFGWKTIAPQVERVILNELAT
jgi:glycosyltransferase involved in cell wall biosynthesis